MGKFYKHNQRFTVTVMKKTARIMRITEILFQINTLGAHIYYLLQYYLQIKFVYYKIDNYDMLIKMRILGMGI